jgi:hypothetical protein
MVGDVVADTTGGLQLALGIMTALYARWGQLPPPRHQ